MKCGFLCRTCGKAALRGLPAARNVRSSGEEHAPPALATGAPVRPVVAAAAEPSPGLAFVLGLFPASVPSTTGSMPKGIIHVVIFGVLISIASSGASASSWEALFGLLIAGLVFLHAVRGIHTAAQTANGAAG